MSYKAELLQAGMELDCLHCPMSTLGGVYLAASETTIKAQVTQDYTYMPNDKVSPQVEAGILLGGLREDSLIMCAVKDTCQKQRRLYQQHATQNPITVMI